MFNTDEAATTPRCSAPMEPVRADTGRRECLRHLAAAGAGVAALTLQDAQPAEAAPDTPPLRGRYLVNHNFALNYMGIETQEGTGFKGRFDDGTHVSGVLVGPNLVMSRTLHDQSVESYVGTVSQRPAPNGRDLFFAGTYYREESAPLPWFATASVRS